jgi:hypothetical protein
MAVGLPLKTTYADGDVYAASDVNDTNGTINITAAPYAAGKNKIINGDFSVAQRGTTFTTSPNYTLDRWYYNNFGTSTNSSTVSRLTASPPTNFSYYCEVAAGAVTTTNLFMSYSMETVDAVRLQGQSVTVSFYYKLPTNFTNTWKAVGVYTTGTNQNLQGGVGTEIGTATTLTNTSSWTRTSFTFTVPSNATSLGINFYSLSNVVAAAKFHFTGVQLEQGSTMTNFQTATGTIQGELAACQRYYYRATFDAAGQRFGSGYATSTTNFRLMVPFPNTFRTRPTALEQSGAAGDYSVETAGTVTSCNVVPTFFTGNVNYGAVDMGVVSGLTTGNGGSTRNVNTSAYFGWSAEL